MNQFNQTGTVTVEEIHNKFTEGMRRLEKEILWGYDPYVSKIVCEFVESLKFELFEVAKRRNALPKVAQRVDLDALEEEQRREAQIERLQATRRLGRSLGLQSSLDDTSE